MKRPLAYITAPWSENEFENTENAAKYCRAVYDAGFSPVCPALFLPLFLRDEIPQEHKDGIDMAREYLRRARVRQHRGRKREKRHCCGRAPADYRHHAGRHPDRQGTGAQK